MHPSSSVISDESYHIRFCIGDRYNCVNSSSGIFIFWIWTDHNNEQRATSNEHLEIAWRCFHPGRVSQSRLDRQGSWHHPQKNNHPLGTTCHANRDDERLPDWLETACSVSWSRSRSCWHRSWSDRHVLPAPSIPSHQPRDENVSLRARATTSITRRDNTHHSCRERSLRHMIMTTSYLAMPQYQPRQHVIKTHQPSHEKRRAIVLRRVATSITRRDDTHHYLEHELQHVRIQ